MSTTSMPGFKEIYKYLVLQSSKNHKKKLRIPKVLTIFFFKFYTTDNDETDNVELVLESKLNRMDSNVGQTTNFKIWPDLTWPWPDLDLKVTLSGPDHYMSTAIGFYG